MKLTRTLSAALLPLWVVACVTINVYFPAAAAEQAADRIIRDVYGETPPGRPQAPATPQAPAAPPHSSAPRATSMVALAAQRLLMLMVTPAYAQADISIDSPAIRALTASMAQRQGKLEPHYRSGAVGMTSDGLITIRDPGAVALKDRNSVRQLVADENQDRNALYGEIARANKHPEWLDEIRSTFARRWVANAPGGWWYQEGGVWKKK